MAHKKQNAREISFNTTSNVDIWLATVNASYAVENDMIPGQATNDYLIDKTKDAVENLRNSKNA